MPERLDRQPWMNDTATRAVVAALEAAGGPGCARFVGGCVRDALLKRAVADIDIATPLTPNEVTAALKAKGLRAVPTGVEYGTVTAIAEHRPFEITTLRRDVETDGRRAVVAFTHDWAEDAGRRDFRLNALYLDPEGHLYDPVGGGVDDALAGRIVFVGDPSTRIREDYLRVLRFFRFTAWYGRGEPDAAALAACTALRAGVAKLSGERVSKELLKLLAAPDPREAVRLMQATGVLDALWPGPLRLDRFEALVPLSPDPALRLAAILPDEGETVRKAAAKLRLSNALRDRLTAAVEGPRVDLAADRAAARAAIYRWGAGAVRDRVMKLWAERPEGRAQARALLVLADTWTAPRFPLAGADVMARGLAAGPAVGRLLGELEDWWVGRDFAPDRAALLAELEARTPRR